MRRGEVKKFFEAIPGVKVIRSSNTGDDKFHGGVDSLTFRGNHICSLPPGNIYLFENNSYVDKNGVRHRAIISILKMLRAKRAITHRQFEAIRKKV